MIVRAILTAAVASSLIGPGGDALAGTKRKTARTPTHLPASSMAPARMIEIRPGYFISSYDCVTDEGYGRFRPCSADGSKN